MPRLSPLRTDHLERSARGHLHSEGRLCRAAQWGKFGAYALTATATRSPEPAMGSAATEDASKAAAARQPALVDLLERHRRDGCLGRVAGVRRGVGHESEPIAAHRPGARLRLTVPRLDLRSVHIDDELVALDSVRPCVGDQCVQQRPLLLKRPARLAVLGGQQRDEVRLGQGDVAIRGSAEVVGC